MSRKSDNQKIRRIRVFARCRPLDSFEILQRSPSMIDVVPERDMLVLKDRNTFREYFFDKVFSQDSDQISIYKTVVEPLIHEVLLGYHCTVFAYGQTGTGKTYTMEGERNDVKSTWEDDPGAGIIPRSMHQLYEELDQLKNVEYSVTASFLEIYNENVYDLLGTNFSKLSLYDDPSLKDSVKVRDLKEVLVKNKDEVYAILEKGAGRRHTAETLLNATSSRSHTIFTVTVNITEHVEGGEKLERCGKLNLVDLAGSENVRRSGAIDKREAGHINQSLLTLGRVITSLIENQPHIPYRESKLTRLLQYSLGGHAKTSIIATFSPALCCLDETISTLEYAAKAKYINIKPEVNRRMLRKALIMNLTEENERLRAEIAQLLKDLKAVRDNQGFFMDAENYEALVKKIALQDKEIEALKSENAKLQQLVDLKAGDVDKLFEKIERKQAAAYANEDFCDKLRTISQTQYAFLHDMVTDYEKEIIEFSELFHHDQSQIRDVLTTHRQKSKAFHELIRNELSSLLNRFSSHLYEQGVGEISWTNDMSKDLHAMKNNFVLKCEEFLKERLPFLLDEINAENTSMNDWVIDVHKSLEDKVNHHKATLDHQTTEERRLLGTLKDTLDLYFINHTKAMNDYKMKILSLQSVCNDEFAKIRNCCAALRDLVQQGAEYENISMFDSSARQLKTAEEPLKLLKSSVRTTGTENKRFGNILEGVNVNEFLRDQDSQTPVISEVTRLVEVLRKLQTDDQAVANNFTAHNSTVQEDLLNNKGTINAIVKTLSEEIGDQEDCLMAHVETLGSLLEHSNCVFYESENKCSEAAARLKDEILKGDFKFEKFLSEELAKYVPTGLTPQRRSSKSPKNYVQSLVRRLQTAGLKSCFKGNDDTESPNTSSFLGSQDTSFASDIYDPEGGESDTSIMTDILFDGKNKENCSGIKKPSKLPKRKSFRFSRSSDKPLSPSNQNVAGTST